MRLRWFLSATVRQATELASHVEKLLRAQRDILSAQAVTGMETALGKMRAAIDSNATPEALRAEMTTLGNTADKWLKPYPHSAIRENIEVLLVAIAVAMAIRTFFLQPFKIPTGSMQPTLFGVTTNSFHYDRDAQLPGIGGRVFEAVAHGTFYHDIKAEADGKIMSIEPPKGFAINFRTVIVQYADRSEPTPVTVWFAPDEDPRRMTIFQTYADVYPGKTFKKGESIIKYAETTGDHLFVDRVSYNFRHPSRGDIIVFKTRDIPLMDSSSTNQFYIKRLVGLSGDRITIGDDRHVRIDGARLDSSTPHFESVYNFDPKGRPLSDRYSGHVNGSYFRGLSMVRSPTYYVTEQSEFTVESNRYVVFGDNTMNSEDSRYWGSLPQKNVIGKSWFVYWPITGRFGWGQR